MKRILLLFTILLVSVLTTACINNLAIQELNNKAVAYMDKGDTETAICRLKSSLDLDAEIYETHYNLAIAYNNIQEYAKAITELKQVLQLKPDFFDAYYTIAVVQEAIAYKVLETASIDEKGEKKLSQDEIIAFTSSLKEAITSYNTYTSKKIDAKDLNDVKKKIAELYEEIQKYSSIKE